MTSRRHKHKKISAFAVAVVITLVLGACSGAEVPGGDVTRPAETGPAVTAERGEKPEPPPLVEPVPIGTVTRSGAGCALEIVAEPIPSGAGRTSVVNGTNRWVSFELLRLASEASFAQFEAFAAEAEVWEDSFGGGGDRSRAPSYGALLPG